MLAAAMVLSAPAVQAQDRAGLVDQARAELPGSATALDLLLRAANPVSAPLDSLWAVAVYDMSDNLINVGEGDLASVWLRWVARHGQQWPIDRIWYPQSVESQYDVAVPAVETDGGIGDGATTTTWTWPSSFDVAAPGTLQVTSADPAVSLSVRVQGGGDIGAGGTLSLPPGTYRITASANGFEPVELSREVLPGAVTRLTFDLPPQLTLAVQNTVVSSLARISFTQGGQLVCSNGIIADPQGLVITALSTVENAAQIDVFTQQGGAFSNYRILRRDAGRGLAVLGPRELQRGAAQLGPAPTVATGVAGAQYAWSVHQPGCADPTQARTRVEWPSQPVAAVALGQSLPNTATGAPLVDRSGGWLGLVTGPNTVLPASLANELIAAARADLVAAGVQVPGGEGGGVPGWVWVAGGLGAAGAAVALLAGGGGGTPTPAGPGSITIFFPNPGSP